MHVVWANSKDFNWIMHSLSRLQLFQLEWAYYEQIAALSTGTCMAWANCKNFNENIHKLSQLQLFKPIRHIFYANRNYFNWNTHGLNQLQWFQVKRTYSEPIAMISSKTQIVSTNCNYFN